MKRPTIQIPNLVVFNHRVHQWIDPYFDNKWVRRLSWGAFGALVFGAVVFMRLRARAVRGGY